MNKALSNVGLIFASVLCLLFPYKVANSQIRAGQTFACGSTSTSSEGDLVWIPIKPRDGRRGGSCNFELPLSSLTRKATQCGWARGTMGGKDYWAPITRATQDDIRLNPQLATRKSWVVDPWMKREDKPDQC